MICTLEIDKKTMHDIKSAAEVTGYSRDYITRLAREGKIVATQVGRQWYLDIESLKQYALVSSIEQQIRQRHLSDERKRGLALADHLKKQKEKSLRSVEIQRQQAVKTVSLVTVALLFTGVISGVLLAPVATSVRVQLASVPVSGGEAVAQETVLFGETTHTEVFSDDPVLTYVLAQKDEGILLLPTSDANQALMPAVDLFSDNVSVRSDEAGQLYIAPADKAGSTTGQEVPFVVVPVNQMRTP